MEPECRQPMPLVRTGVWMIELTGQGKRYRLEFCSNVCMQRGRKRLIASANKLRSQVPAFRERLTH